MARRLVKSSFLTRKCSLLRLNLTSQTTEFWQRVRIVSPHPWNLFSVAKSLRWWWFWLPSLRVGYPFSFSLKKALRSTQTRTLTTFWLLLIPKWRNTSKLGHSSCNRTVRPLTLQTKRKIGVSVTFLHFGRRNCGHLHRRTWTLWTLVCGPS